MNEDVGGLDLFATHVSFVIGMSVRYVLGELEESSSVQLSNE